MDTQTMAVYNVASYTHPLRSQQESLLCNPYTGAYVNQQQQITPASAFVKQERYSVDDIPSTLGQGRSEGFVYANTRSAQSSPANSPQTCPSLAPSPDMNNSTTTQDRKQEVEGYWSNAATVNSSEAQSLCDSSAIEEECFNELIDNYDASFSQMNSVRQPDGSFSTNYSNTGLTALTPNQLQNTCYSQYHPQVPETPGLYQTPSHQMLTYRFSSESESNLSSDKLYSTPQTTSILSGGVPLEHSSWSSYNSMSEGSEASESEVNFSKKCVITEMGNKTRTNYKTSPTSYSDSEMLPDGDLITMSVRELNRWVRGWRYESFF